MKAFAKDVHKERMQRRHFPPVKKAKGILGIVQWDVCGPMSSSSLSRYLYYVSFLDYFSHKTWIYFLKWKNEVFSKFKEYKSLVENQTNRKPNTLRLDND